MVFQDTHFVLLVIKTKWLVQAGQCMYCFILERYFLIVLMMQSSISSLSPSTKSNKEEIVNSSNLRYKAEGLWVLAKKLEMKHKVHDLECLT